MKLLSLFSVVVLVVLGGCLCDVTVEEYNELQAELIETQAELIDVEYQLMDAQEPPYVTIEGRNVTFAFKKLDGEVESWVFPFDSYESSYNRGYDYREAGPEYLKAYGERMLSENNMCEMDTKVSVSSCNYAAVLGGNVDCVQRKIDRDAHCKKMAEIQMMTYRYIEKTRTIPIMDLNYAGKQTYTLNFSLFVEGYMFENVIPPLYEEAGSDEEFIKEVFNIVQQITTYVLDIGDTPRYSLETLTGAGGDCEDSSILMASMLRAASPDWIVQLVYLDADNPLDPQTMNHVIVYVDTGTYSRYVETTAKTYYDYYPDGVNGWIVEV
ncbi:hypothetical protein ACFLQ2_02670 [archaeon]